MFVPSWLIRLALIVGLCASGVGVVSGIVIGTRDGQSVDCPNDRPGSCTDYPNAADGWAVIAISLMLAAVIILVAANQRVEAPAEAPTE